MNSIFDRLDPDAKVPEAVVPPRDIVADEKRRADNLMSWGVAFALSTVAILTHYFLYSSDDLYMSTLSNSVAQISVEQASNGRFTSWFVLSNLEALGFSYGTYVIVSGVAFAYTSAWLLQEVFAFGRIDSLRARVVGSALYLTFGFNLDLYQSKDVYLSFALAFGFAALALRIGRTQVEAWLRFVGAAICIMLSLGSYQASAQILILAIGVWALSQLIDDERGGAERAAWPIVPAGATGVVAYVVVNKFLELFQVGGPEAFASFPGRHPSGLQNVATNAGKYLNTIAELLSPTTSVYFPLTNPVLSAGYGALLLVALILFTYRAGSIAKKCAVWGVVIGALLCAPNPANLAMPAYWPSARSVAGIAIFFAGVAALLLDRLAPPRGGSPILARAITHLLLALISVQTFSDAYVLGRRAIQQQTDFVLAQQIVADIERLRPETGTPITAYVAQSWNANLIYRNVPFGFGAGLFDTDWSAPALLTLVSGGAVVGKWQDRAACAAVKSSVAPVITVQSEGEVSVCLPLRRIGSGTTD